MLFFILGFFSGIILFIIYQLFIFNSSERKLENGRSNNK